MSIQDRIAKLLLVKHSRVLSNKTAQGDYWSGVRSRVQQADQDIIESASVKVRFANGTKLVCEVADDERSQTVGLQKYASLPDGYGMLFPFSEPRKATFHMGTVPFPIDIMFVGSNGRISKIVEHAEPGSRERWGMSHVSAVVEAAAGFCRSNKISVGDEVSIPLNKDASMAGVEFKFYNGDVGDESQVLVGTILGGPDESGMYVGSLPDGQRIKISSDMLADGIVVIERMFDGPSANDDLDKESQMNNGIDPGDRFRGHDLVDNQLDTQSADPANFSTTMGHDPMLEMDDQDPTIPSI